MSEATIDRATFRQLQETAGADFIVELVEAFLEEAPRMLEELDAALAARDAEKFRRIAHSLKSNSNTFGAVGLGAMARELELSGLEHAAERNPRALAELAREYAAVAAALAEMRHE